MPYVTVSINGRQVRLACEAGDEDHMVNLAGDLDRRIQDLRGSYGEIGEARLTLMASLSLGDELATTRAKLRKAEAELAALQTARAASGERQKETQAAISAAFNSAAERIEIITRRLNQSVGDDGVAMG